MKRTPRHTLLRAAAALSLLLPALTACTIVSRTVPADPAWTAARHYIYTLRLNDVKDVALYINVRDWNERNYSITF